jgi:hypothetical protein
VVPSTSADTSQYTFGAPAGISNANGTEADVQTLSPEDTLVVSGLEATEDGGPIGLHDSITVRLDVNGSQAMACVIGGGGSSCNSGTEAVQVPGGSALSISIEPQSGPVSGTTIPGFNLLFGFEATT